MNLNKNIVIAHDVGTSSVKSAVVSSEGHILNHATHSYPFYTPQPGWVEQEAADYWNGIVANTRKLISEIDKKQILGMVFTTQAMGIIPVDKNGNAVMSEHSLAGCPETVGRSDDFITGADSSCDY